MAYERAKETAKKVRKALKAAFPGIKFSVRSSTYTGGSSLRVSWVDGPRNKEVQEVTSKYKSSTFDGMTDMKTTHGYKDPETGEMCSGADYIFVERERSEELTEKIKKMAEKLTGNIPDPTKYGYHMEMHEAEEALNGEKPIRFCRSEESWNELFNYAKELKAS